MRAYDKGKPTGVWWSWWRTGALRSTYVHEPGVPTPMTWWHPNGLLASQGMAVEGRRVGEWTFWHDNGALESRGEMAGGQRVGFWTFFDEEGEWSERGSYLSGKRRQDWEFRGSLGGTLPFSGRR